ncbi:MAG: flagellar hook-associated protein FlgK [Chthoniobacter sp.]|nr:flagellar hook-associated protein FlgK [Chthoniobacter sp.]
MSGLIGGLINAAKSLTAQEAGVQVAGRNLANVNNPEYSRQRVVLGNRVMADSKLGPVGSGVEALGIKQIRDQFLDATVTRETSVTASLQAQQTALDRAQANLGEQIDRSKDSAFIGDIAQSSNGIGTALSGFFNGFDHLAASPMDNGAKQVLLNQAENLVDKFNSADTRLQGVQTDLTAQVDGGVGNVNSLLKQIADLNGAIAQFEVGAPGSALELRDQRQARLEELSGYMDFEARVIPNGAGQIQVVARDTSGSDVMLVSKTAVLGGISFDGVQISGGAPSVALGLQGGAMKGQLLARDVTIQKLRDDLKTAANQIATAVNAAYAPTGGNFFQIPPAAGLLALDPSLSFSTIQATATGDAGANEIALAVSDVARAKFSTVGGDLIDGTIGAFYNKTVSGLGQSLSGLEAKLGDQEIVQKMLTNQRDSVSGVSMDEEMGDLMKFQRSYQASARVVRVMDELLDGLVNGLIR